MRGKRNVRVYSNFSLFNVGSYLIFFWHRYRTILSFTHSRMLMQRWLSTLRDWFEINLKRIYIKQNLLNYFKVGVYGKHFKQIEAGSFFPLAGNKRVLSFSNAYFTFLFNSKHVKKLGPFLYSNEERERKKIFRNSTTWPDICLSSFFVFNFISWKILPSHFVFAIPLTHILLSRLWQK